MSKELDDSLFDDSTVHPESAASSLDDSLFDDSAAHPDSAPVEEPEAESTDPVGDATKATMASAMGAGGGVLLNKGLEKGVNIVANNLGDLDATQIKAIDENRDLYKNATPLEDMMEQFRNLGEKTRQGGIDSAAQGRKALEKLPNLPVEEYYKTLAQPALDPKLSSEIAPDKQSEILAAKLDEYAPQNSEDKLKIAAIESEMSVPYHDERLGINQSIKDAKYDRKLEQLNAPLPENQKLSVMDNFEANKTNQKLSQFEQMLAQVQGKTPDQAIERKDDFLFHNENRIDKENKLREIDVNRGKKPDLEKGAVIENHNAQRDERKLLRLDENIAKTEEKIAKESQKLEQKKQAFQENMIARNEKTASLRDINESNAKSRIQTRKDQLVFNKILEDEKNAQMKNLKQKEKMEKLLEDKAKLEAKIQGRAFEAQDKATAEFDSIKNTPKKIRNVAPELENKILGQDYANSLQDAISDVEHSSEISPVRLDQKLQEIRDNVPEGKANTVGKFNEKLSQAVREDLRKRSPEYAAAMDKSSETFKTEALFDKLGIRYNKDLDRVTLDDSGKSKINSTLLDPKKNDSSYAYLKEALEDAKRQGNLPANATVEDMLKTGEVSALKGEVGRLREGKALNAFDVNSIAKGEMSRAPGIVGKMGGTKIQELYALYKNSLGGKMVQAGSKYGLPVLGAVAAGASAASAAESGDLSPEAAVVAGAAEIANPLPGVDVVEGAKQASKNIDQTLLTSPQEDLTAQPEMGPDALGGADLVSQNPLIQSAVKGFAEGAVSPIPDLAKGAVNGLNNFGTSQSNDARSRMEQNMKASFKKEAPHEEFRSFVEQRPEQIQELAQYFSNDPSMASFVAPLEKAAAGDERTRSAVLFGLYQQPAFRHAMKAKKGM